MDPLKLGTDLVSRLRDAYNRGLDLTIVEDFVGVNSEAIHRWFNKNKAPRGENLGRLWYLLAALDLPSPELENLSAYQHYLGELLAYRVVSFGYFNVSEPTYNTGNNDTVREIVNEKRHREAFAEQAPEIAEMMCQYDHDYAFDSQKFQNTFGVQPTSYRDGFKYIFDTLARTI